MVPSLSKATDVKITKSDDERKSASFLVKIVTKDCMPRNRGVRARSTKFYFGDCGNVNAIILWKFGKFLSFGSYSVYVHL